MTSATRELADTVQEIGLGLIDIGVAGRRPRLHPREHPSRVVLRRPRRDLGRRGRRADLPDQLPRGVPVGDLRLRRHARSSARTRSSSRRSSPSATRSPGIRTIIVIDPPPRGGRERLCGRRTLGAITLEQVRERGRSHSARGARGPARGGARRRTRSRSSTPPARPARRRAACSRTATTARSSTWSARPARSRATRSSTSTSRSPTRSRC